MVSRLYISLCVSVCLSNVQKALDVSCLLVNVMPQRHQNVRKYAYLMAKRHLATLGALGRRLREQ